MSSRSRKKDNIDKVFHRSGKRTIKEDKQVNSLITKFSELSVDMAETLDKLNRTAENLSYGIDDFLTENKIESLDNIEDIEDRIAEVKNLRDSYRCVHIDLKSESQAIGFTDLSTNNLERISTYICDSRNKIKTLRK